MSRRDVLLEVAVERTRQDNLWGEQNHDDPRWGAILGEEFGEVCQEVNGVTFGNAREHLPALRNELIQVAAVAVSWAEAIDRRFRGEEGS